MPNFQTCDLRYTNSYDTIQRLSPDCDHFHIHCMDAQEHYGSCLTQPIVTKFYTYVQQILVKIVNKMISS